MAFTRVAFFRRLNICAICAVLASLKLVFYLRLQESLFFDKADFFTNCLS